VVKRAPVIAGTIVWGETYVRNWLNYVLPSWLSSGNLPALFNQVDGEFRIYTRKEDIPFLDESPLGHKLKDIAPIKIYLMEVGGSPAVNITHDMFHNGIVADARAQDKAVFYLAPDVIWSDGALGHIGRSLSSGNVRVIVHDYRVVTETITTELNDFRLKDGTIRISRKRKTRTGSR
jgi:hypothetical protein